jgi:nucleoside-diphosphate-sugar epimerase
MKLLITGSSGNIGYFLSKYFTSNKITVIGLDLDENPVWPGNKYFKFYRADVRDNAAIEEIFSKEKPTHVIHLAYLMKSIHNIKEEHEIDVQGSKNVAITSRVSEKATKIITKIAFLIAKILRYTHMSAISQ